MLSSPRRRRRRCIKPILPDPISNVVPNQRIHIRPATFLRGITDPRRTHTLRFPCLIDHEVDSARPFPLQPILLHISIRNTPEVRQLAINARQIRGTRCVLEILRGAIFVHADGGSDAVPREERCQCRQRRRVVRVILRREDAYECVEAREVDLFEMFSLWVWRSFRRVHPRIVNGRGLVDKVRFFGDSYVDYRRV